MISYNRATQEEELVKDIIITLNLNYIDVDRVRVVYSTGSKSRAIARIWSIPKVIINAFEMKPVYVIELISERFFKLSYEDKIRVLIHEILHIPYNFSGGLRSHGKKVNSREVNKLYKKYFELKAKNSS